jgi:hypothetical protein
MIKKHLPLVVAIALPIIFIGILALVIMLPSMRISPQHDFLYIDLQESSVGSRAYPYVNIQYQNTYKVVDGKLTMQPIGGLQSDGSRIMPDGSKAFPYEGENVEYVEAPTLYYYSVTENTSREISFADAQQLPLSAGPSSPDGYTVKYEYNSDGIFELFGSDNNSGHVIMKGNGRKMLTGMPTSEYYYGDNFTLIGWVN